MSPVTHKGCVITLFQQFVGLWIAHVEPGPELHRIWGRQFDIGVTGTQRQALAAAKAEILHMRRYDRIDADERYSRRVWRRRDLAKQVERSQERSYLQPGWQLPQVSA